MISGIFRTGVNSLDESVFQMGLADARDLLGMEKGSQSILLMLDDYRQAGKAAAILTSSSGFGADSGLSVLPWTKIGEYPRLVALARSMYVWIWLFVAFLGAFIIANVLMMVILERRRETGILMSMGMPRREILGLFVLEGSMIGAAGSVAGALLGTVFNLAIQKKGFDMTSAMSAMTWPMDNVIHPSASIGTALAVIAMGTLVAAIVSWLPARTASRMNPVDAIRSV
jgi:ABC-type lipoprotein release transport system permease subunit